MSDSLAINRLTRNNQADTTFRPAIDSFDVTETFAAVFDLINVVSPSESTSDLRESTETPAHESVADVESARDESETDEPGEEDQPTDSTPETDVRAAVELDRNVSQHEDQEISSSSESSDQAAEPSELVELDADNVDDQEPVVSADQPVQHRKRSEAVVDSDAKPVVAAGETATEVVTAENDSIVQRSPQQEQAEPIEVAAIKPLAALKQPQPVAGVTEVVDNSKPDQPRVAESAQSSDAEQPRRRRKKQHRHSIDPRPGDLPAHAGRANSTSVTTSRSQSPQAASMPLPPAELQSPTGSNTAVQVTSPQVTASQVTAPSTVQPSVIQSATTPQGSSGSAIPPAASVGSAKAEPSVKAAPTKTLAPEGTKLDLADRARLLQRVARAFQQLGTDGGSLKIRLHPPRLGSVGIEVGVSGRKMNARIVTESEVASQVLRDSVPELRARLAEQGFQIESIEITSDDFGGAGQGRGGQQEDSFGHSFGLPTEKTPPTASVPNMDPQVRPTEILVSTAGVDLVA